MDLKTLTLHLRTPINDQLHCSSTLSNQSSVNFYSQRRCRNQRIQISPSFHRCKLPISACFSPSKEEVISEELDVPCEKGASVSSANDEGEGKTELIEHKGVEVDEKDSVWDRIVEILKFTGPATGLWICGPFMSLIDTVVIGQCSSLELAALGPGTVLCDNVSYVFMFLAIATSNMVATALARQDKEEVQQQISKLIFIGLACGVAMLFFTKFLGTQALIAFTGSKNAHIIPAANTYVQIRGLAWPIALVGWVTQSASLGMKDAWGPLKALAAATVVNVIGDVVLCLFLGYGIAGAAWATMASQVVAGYVFIESLNEKGYNALAISVPSLSELLQILAIATPVFVTMMSKVAFYSLMVYFATSMGTHIVASHQVMIQLYGMCAACAEPLSQTAQSFMPELLYGVGRSLPKARALLKSMLVLGALGGLVLGCIGTFVPFMFPNLFSPDPQITGEMKTILIPFFLAMCVGPSIHCLEGTLLAGRDLKFLSLSMSGCFLAGSLFLLLLSSRGFGLSACWFALVGFQWSRLFIGLRRLLAPEGVLFSEISSTQHQFGNLGAA